VEISENPNFAGDIGDLQHKQFPPYLARRLAHDKGHWKIAQYFELCVQSQHTTVKTFKKYNQEPNVEKTFPKGKLQPNVDHDFYMYY
jgi:hypothetical protein